MVEKKTAARKAGNSSAHIKGNDGPVLKGNVRRRPYAAPRILSSEVLELAAGMCEPSGTAFGKNFCAEFGT